MSGKNTVRMINAYNQQLARPTLFFSGMFESPPQNFYDSEDVEIDITRGDEDIAIVVQDLSAGYRKNTADVYTNKRFKAPIYKESVPINSTDLIKRQPGSNPFESLDYRANALRQMMQGMAKVEAKIRRAVEQQASQVLQTGTATLTDENGAALYSIDYKPKATHFPTAAVSWATATGKQMRDDLSGLAEEIRDNGLEDPDRYYMGTDAFETFISNAENQARFDNLGIDMGRLAGGTKQGSGATYRGVIDLGNYKFEVWTYNGKYKDPQTGNKLRFLDAGKVICRSGSGRLDATFGAIPNIGKLLGQQPTQLLPDLPGRFSNRAGGMDLFTNVWLTDDGEQMFGGVGSRPLLIPTAIDTFGCLDTQL